MGTAIAGIAEKGGHGVQLLGHQDQSEVVGDVVVLAVPYPALGDIIEKRGAQLAGKVVVDLTNPLDFETYDRLTVPADSSAAAEIAAALPDSQVVKAFNTNFAGTLVSGEVGGKQTTVLVAGDDAEAKATVSDLVASGGLAAVDAGDLRRARELEAIGFLQITLAAAERIGWTGGFAVQS